MELEHRNAREELLARGTERLVRQAVEAERARIRRELLGEIATLKAARRHFLTSRLDDAGVMTIAIHEDDLVAALDRICPEEG